MSYLVYDADCGFCTKSARWIAKRGGVEIRPWQTISDLGGLGLTEQMVSEAAYWVTPGQSLSAGPAAIARALESSGGWRRPIGRLIRLRLVLPVARRVYERIAVNRYRMPGSSGSCKMPNA